MPAASTGPALMELHLAGLPLPPAAPPPRLRRQKLPRPPVPPPGTVSSQQPPPPQQPPPSQLPRPPEAGTQQILHEGPYSGDFNGAAWNSRGYFVSTVAGQARKRLQVTRILHTRDFVMLEEAHCTPGGILGHREIPGTRSWWSCGTAARAGVGIILKEAFLQQFSLAEPDWLELEPGRLARLRLRGGAGVLDLFVAYFPTGTRKRLHGDSGEEDLHEADPALRQQRQQLVVRIRRVLEPAVALAVLAGDFNFVTDAHDRINLYTGLHTGDRDGTEQAHWSRTIPQHMLHEWYQE